MLGNSGLATPYRLKFEGFIDDSGWFLGNNEKKEIVIRVSALEICDRRIREQLYPIIISKASI